MSEYFPILLFLMFAFALSCILCMIPLVLGVRKPDKEKISPYECGFDPIEEENSNFDVRFYLVAILFVIFDLEIAFLFPWAISLRDIGLLGFASGISFLTILTIGFIYEWKKGALEWE